MLRIAFLLLTVAAVSLIELVRAWTIIKPVHRIRTAILRRKLRKASKRGEMIDLGYLKKESEVNADQLLGIARHVLTTLGGGLVSAGVVSESELSAIVGGLVVLGGVVWSYLAKRKAQ